MKLPDGYYLLTQYPKSFDPWVCLVRVQDGKYRHFDRKGANSLQTKAFAVDLFKDGKWQFVMPLSGEARQGDLIRLSQEAQEGV